MSRRSPKVSRRSGTRSTLSSRRAAVIPGRPGALDRDAAAARAEGTAVGAPLARCGGSPRTSARTSIIERYYNFGGEGIGAAARVGATAVLEVNAPVIDYPGSAKRRLDRALLVEPMRRWRERICARADVIVTPSCGHPSAGHSAVEGRRARVGRRHRTIPARRCRARRRSPGQRPSSRCLPGRSAAGTAPSTSSRDPRAARTRSRATLARCSSATGPELAAVREAARGVRRDRVHRRAAARPHARVPCRVRHRRRAIRRRTRTARSRSGSTGRRSRFSNTWPRVCRSSRPRRIGSRRSSVTSAKACSTLLTQPGALAAALERLADPAAETAARCGRTDARRSRLQLGGALQGARRRHRRGTATFACPGSHLMHILVATDAFPPVCGGSGWSTYELARGLRARGHRVTGRPAEARHPAGTYASERSTAFVSLEFGATAPPIPYVRNYFKNERLYPRLADFLADLIARERHRHGARPARDHVSARNRRRTPGRASRRCARSATTGRSVTGPI